MQLHTTQATRKAAGFRAAAVATFCALLPAGAALAAADTLTTYENANVPTSFTLTFPDLGLVSSSNVVTTRYTLVVDEETGTAHFTDYYQIVEPLLLPLNISTGAIEVRIVSSEGVYDAATQTFTTNDLYQISFANDLSFFGFESPVVIPSVSQGTIDGGAKNAKSIGMVWEGSGQLENSENPAEPFEYTYVCSSNTLVANDPSQIPALPSLSAVGGAAGPNSMCGAGACGVTGFAAMSMTFLGLGAMKLRRTRRRR